ncbi:MAG: phage tail assembly chaperone [Rhodobacteraceae bacterium]|nr:phage tail assembly chaperone [Paracoccaceae bacterium]MCF8512973.1 phage tail assembly chaperone [Paracoccaceae bacterium]MCF8517218.1 phage tail assembly chaperone [Paracoccaceae bacterium]
MPNAMLAPKDIRLVHGFYTVRLRPSLRAAMQLERLHDGFAPLFDRLSAFNLATVQQIILATATDPDQAERFLASFATTPLQRLAEITQAPLADLITGFLPRSPKGDTAQGRAVPWSDAYAQLYRFGTGWLQWTPEQTWAATPAEILEAVEGHIGKLKAMNGRTEDNGDLVQGDEIYTADRLHQIAEQGFDPEFDRAGLHALKGKL